MIVVRALALALLLAACDSFSGESGEIGGDGGLPEAAPSSDAAPPGCALGPATTDGFDRATAAGGPLSWSGPSAPFSIVEAGAGNTGSALAIALAPGDGGSDSQFLQASFAPTGCVEISLHLRLEAPLPEGGLLNVLEVTSPQAATLFGTLSNRTRLRLSVRRPPSAADPTPSPIEIGYVELGTSWKTLRIRLDLALGSAVVEFGGAPVRLDPLALPPTTTLGALRLGVGFPSNATQGRLFVDDVTVSRP